MTSSMGMGHPSNIVMSSYFDTVCRAESFGDIAALGPGSSHLGSPTGPEAAAHPGCMYKFLMPDACREVDLALGTQTSEEDLRG